MSKPKIIIVVGNRPQYVKLSALDFPYKLINTGQHYSDEMSKIFFNGLKLPNPDWNLNETELGPMVDKIKNIISLEKPDVVLVIGDTRSTMAGALATSELNIPLGHIEAGLRSFDMRMAEEKYRKMVDHVSKFLFCPTKTAVDNLRDEGIKTGVYNTGDILYDVYVKHMDRSDFTLATIHRAENVDDAKRLKEIMDILGDEEYVIFPMHPRTKKQLEYFNIKTPDNIQVVKPVSYLEMLRYIAKASLIITDSGGVQREACFAGTPCVVLRDTNEWHEAQAFGDGTAGKKIYEILCNNL